MDTLVERMRRLHPDGFEEPALLNEPAWTWTHSVFLEHARLPEGTPVSFGHAGDDTVGVLR